MKIGIIGSGNVGGTLGTRWAQGGHDVVFSSRKPDSPEMKELVAKAGTSARAGSVADAVQAGDVVLLAMPWPAAREVVQGLGDLGGKVLIDAMNPLLPRLEGLELGTTTSAGEQVAQWARKCESREGVQHRRVQHHGEPGLRRRPRGDVLLRR